jgi:hypothetical protein
MAPAWRIGFWFGAAFIAIRFYFFVVALVSPKLRELRFEGYGLEISGAGAMMQFVSGRSIAALLIATGILLQILNHLDLSRKSGE